MILILPTRMDEGGTYIVNIATTDEDGAAVAPSSLAWTLTDRTGKIVINNRKEVPILSPTASEDIVLDGADCAVLFGEHGNAAVTRILTITGTYNSALGTGLHLRGRCRILLDNYAALPIA